MESRIKPIPAFYCCYLLRSTVRHGSLYVGSSPDPLRRLNQHNGKAQGGAVRTSRLSLRPWEMACIVAGFPSNIAALQFEWAWQNAHLTRHIAQDERISFPVTKITTNRKTGKTRKKPGRPPSSLLEKLSNLHLLLRTRYFSQWPLELRFFSEDVYKTWQSWSQRVDKSIRPEIHVMLDLPQLPAESTEPTETASSSQSPIKRHRVDMIGKGGIEGIDATYARYQDLLEKSKFILDEEDGQKCEVCRSDINIRKEIYTVCTVNGCTSMAHVTCLSDKFLQNSEATKLVPEGGKCPGCGNQIEWSDLMRSVSLRTRGEKEIQRLLKKKRGTKAATAANITEEEENEDEDEADNIEMLSANVAGDQEDAGPDDVDDNMTVTSNDSFDSTLATNISPARKAAPDSKIEIIIEDSEDDE